MTSQVQSSNFAAYLPATELTDAEQWSFWDLVDLGASHRYGVAELIRKYNFALPSCKGRLRSGESLVAKLLLHLMSLEMEKMRVESPADYYYYLSDKIDCIPVATNRGQLRTMLDSFYSKNTIGSYIGRLMDCGIIKRKLNTSRVTQRIKDEDGNISFVKKATDKGRGNMLLFINKEVLFWVQEVVSEVPKLDVDKLEIAPTTSAFSPIENQGLSYGKTQNLGQSLQESLETLKRNQNKCGKGAAELPACLSSVPSEESKQIGDKASRSCPPREVPIFVVNELERFIPGGGGRYVDNYHDRVNFEQRFVSRLPQNDLDYFTMLLFAQVRGQIYPHFSDAAVQMKEVQAKILLKLHLQRPGGSLFENFQTITRAISLTKNWLAAKQERYVYDILTWLRIDGEYNSGTLLHVIEEWIPKERTRLSIILEKDKKLLNWQIVVSKAELLFSSFAKKLRKGFHTAVAAARSAARSLRTFCEEAGINGKSKTNIIDGFVEKVNIILQQTQERGKRGQILSLQKIHKLTKRDNERSSR